jgi:hypothetical protein
MAQMGSRSATELLLLPVQLDEIRLGRPVDLLLDAVSWRVLGFVVLCGDEVQRFLAWAAADLRDDAVGVPSALLLLDDVEFYRGRSRSFRTLLGAPVAGDRGEIGRLRDLLLASDGTVSELLVKQGDGIREVAPASVRVEHVSAV